MQRTLPDEIRVLALDPSPEGFGFAVLEGPERMIDWGVKSIPPDVSDKNAACVKLATELIERYRPLVLAVEDASAPSSRRQPRVKELLELMRQLAGEKRLRVANLSPMRVHRAFRPRKDVIAAALAGRFPELAPQLPRPRKCGDSEHSAMPVFDAAALGSTFFYFRNRIRLHEERKALRTLASGSRGGFDRSRSDL
jgi:hypothetical protein